MAPRNQGVEPWDTLPENQRRLAARLQEAFAAFLEHTDAQIGRLVAVLENLDRLDNTLFILLSDNGASQEGGPFGVMHEMKYFNFLVETPDEAVERIDDIGGPHSHSNYPWGWAQAGNTPFKWYKQNTHEGGVHVPLIIHWPNRIRDRGSVRDQFHHVDDIVPTIYETLGVEAPTIYRGFEQIPISGVSMRYSFDAPDAPSTKAVQYYEMMGHRAIYSDGWKAVTRHQSGTSFEDDDWELYLLAEDRSECDNLAAAMPDKLTRMIELWWREAEEYGVLPLDDRTIELFFTRYRDGFPHPSSRRYTYFPPISPLPGTGRPGTRGPRMGDGRHHRATAGRGRRAVRLGHREFGDQPVHPGRPVGDGLQLLRGPPCEVSDATVPVGAAVVGARFRRSGKSAEATLVIDGRDSGTLDIPFAMTMISSVGPRSATTMGRRSASVIRGDFPFEGNLKQLDVTVLHRPSTEGSSEAQAAERAAMTRQ